MLSSFEIFRQFTKHVDSNSLAEVPKDILEAHEKLQEREKLALILKSKATHKTPVAVGDMV